MKKNDPPIDEIRKVRSRISKKFDHDPEKLIQYYIELQKKYEKKLHFYIEGETTAEKTGPE